MTAWKRLREKAEYLYIHIYKGVDRMIFSKRQAREFVALGICTCLMGGTAFVDGAVSEAAAIAQDSIIPRL